MFTIGPPHLTKIFESNTSIMNKALIRVKGEKSILVKHNMNPKIRTQANETPTKLQNVLMTV